MDVSYYTKINRFTRIHHEQWIVPLLKWDLDFLFDCVKSILIHPIDTKHEKVKYDRSQNGVFHALHTTVDRILQYEKLRLYLDERVLPLQTIPQDRAVLSCDHHALLFTSFVRHQNIPIRARTGFAKYLVKNALIPHWVAEIYDENRKAWNLIDPERRIKSVDRNDFVFAHQAWLRKKNNPQEDFPGYSGSKDRQGLKYAVISDLNCIFKNELLGYEWRHTSFQKKKPEIVHLSYERLTATQQHDINEIAELMENPDKNFEQLQRFYATYIMTDISR